MSKQVNRRSTSSRKKVSTAAADVRTAPTEEIVMTPLYSKTGKTMRMERVPIGDQRASRVFYSAEEGPYSGIVVNKATNVGPCKTEPSSVRRFTAHVQANNTTAATKEIRELRFWFKPNSSVNEETTLFFKRLLDPTAFPADHLSYVKNLLSLVKEFKNIRVLELDIRPFRKLDAAVDMHGTKVIGSSKPLRRVVSTLERPQKESSVDGNFLLPQAENIAAARARARRESRRSLRRKAGSGSQESSSMLRVADSYDNVNEPELRPQACRRSASVDILVSPPGQSTWVDDVENVDICVVESLLDDPEQSDIKQRHRKKLTVSKRSAKHKAAVSPFVDVDSVSCGELDATSPKSADSVQLMEVGTCSQKVTDLDGGSSDDNLVSDVFTQEIPSANNFFPLDTSSVRDHFISPRGKQQNKSSKGKNKSMKVDQQLLNMHDFTTEVVSNGQSNILHAKSSASSGVMPENQNTKPPKPKRKSKPERDSKGEENYSANEPENGGGNEYEENVSVPAEVFCYESNEEHGICLISPITAKSVDTYSTKVTTLNGGSFEGDLNMDEFCQDPTAAKFRPLSTSSVLDSSVPKHIQSTVRKSKSVKVKSKNKKDVVPQNLGSIESIKANTNNSAVLTGKTGSLHLATVPSSINVDNGLLHPEIVLTKSAAKSFKPKQKKVSADPVVPGVHIYVDDGQKSSLSESLMTSLVLPKSPGKFSTKANMKCGQKDETKANGISINQNLDLNLESVNLNKLAGQESEEVLDYCIAEKKEIAVKGIKSAKAAFRTKNTLDQAKLSSTMHAMELNPEYQESLISDDFPPPPPEHLLLAFRNENVSAQAIENVTKPKTVKSNFKKSVPSSVDSHHEAPVQFKTNDVPAKEDAPKKIKRMDKTESAPGLDHLTSQYEKDRPSSSDLILIEWDDVQRHDDCMISPRTAVAGKSNKSVRQNNMSKDFQHPENGFSGKNILSPCASHDELEITTGNQRKRKTKKKTTYNENLEDITSKVTSKELTDSVALSRDSLLTEEDVNNNNSRLAKVTLSTCIRDNDSTSEAVGGAKPKTVASFGSKSIVNSTSKLKCKSLVSNEHEISEFSENKQPSVVILTGLDCEKETVEAMCDSKPTIIRRPGQHGGQEEVFTIGCLDNRIRLVIAKLAKYGFGAGARKEAQTVVSQILGAFPSIVHVIFVGVGGAVCCYDVDQVRLGDVIISSIASEPSRPVYMRVESVITADDPHPDIHVTGTWRPEDSALSTVAGKLQKTPKKLSKQVDSCVADGLVVLNGVGDDGLSAGRYNRPDADTDILYRADGKTDQPLLHPPIITGSLRANRINLPLVHFGAVATGQVLTADDDARLDLARLHQVKVVDPGWDEVIKAIEAAGLTSWVVIRGTADYADGRSRQKNWRPYASLAAAAVMKCLLLNMNA